MRTALLFALLWAGAAAAHEVHHAVASDAAVVVRLNYADGRPFAYEKYELTPEGATVPAQVGNSDAEGRVVFVPGTAANWRLRAFSADGHGVDLRLAVPARQAAAPADGAPSRASLALFGLGAILAGFGLVQLIGGKRRDS